MDRNDDRARSGAGGTGGSSGAGSSGGAAGSSGYGDSGDLSGSAAYGASGGGGGSTGSSFGGGSTGRGGMSGDESVADRARDVMSNAQEKLADVGSTVRERAGTAKNQLADMLETGANKLRQRAQGASGSTAFAGATGDGSAQVQADTGRMGQVNTRVAGGMQATADFLRDADLDGLRTGVERQVRDHPGRTLLIALGLGYVIGKAFRR